MQQREGLVIFLMEGRERTGILGIVEKGKFNIIPGLTGIAIKKRDSVPSLRRLIGELPADLQAIARDFAASAKSTMTQDDQNQAVMLRSIEIPKKEVINLSGTQCLSYADLKKVHPIQAPAIAVVRKAFLAQ